MEEISGIASLTLFLSSDIVPKDFDRTAFSYVLPSCSIAFCKAIFLISFFKLSSKLETPFDNRIQ